MKWKMDILDDDEIIESVCQQNEGEEENEAVMKEENNENQEKISNIKGRHIVEVTSRYVEQQQ